MDSVEVQGAFFSLTAHVLFQENEFGETLRNEVN